MNTIPENKREIETYLISMMQHFEKVLIDSPSAAFAAYLAGKIISKLCRLYDLNEVEIYRKA